MGGTDDPLGVDDDAPTEDEPVAVPRQARLPGRLRDVYVEAAHDLGRQLAERLLHDGLVVVGSEG